MLVAVGWLLLIGVILAMLGAHSGSRGALQACVSKLQAEGEKLTCAELMRGRLTNTFDSQAVLTNVSASLKGGKLSPALLDVRRYVGPGKAVVNWQEPSPVWIRSSGPSSRGTWEELETQMQGGQEELQQAREALKTPAPDGGPLRRVVGKVSRLYESGAERNAVRYFGSITVRPLI